MSVFGSAVSLALLAVLVFCCPAARARTCSNYVSETLKQTHDFIADPLGLKLSVVAEKPLFSNIMKIINSSFERREQVLIMNATLDIYLKIFSSLLENNQAQTGLLDQLAPQVQDPVRKALLDLQKKVVELKRHMFQSRGDKVRRVLNTLDDIQVDDALVQKKALAEFKHVYQAASVIGSKHCGHTS